MPNILNTKHMLAVAVAVALSLAVAWGASSYYGERRLGQEMLVPPQANILTYADFSWPMEREAEVIIDPDHLAETDFEPRRFSFKAVEDTYFGVNLADQKVISSYHFIVSIFGMNRQEGFVSITLSQFDGDQPIHFASDNVAVPEGDFRVDLDLESLIFRRHDMPDKEFRWGRDFDWANRMRFDWDGFDDSRLSIYSIFVRSGVSVDHTLADFADSAELDAVQITRTGIKLERKEKSGSITTPTLGVGSVRRFHDLRLSSSVGEVSAEIRSGMPTDGGDWNWSDWLAIGEEGTIDSLPLAPYVQVRLDLTKQRGEDGPSVEGFRLRVIDPSPPGLGGPLFGTSHIPTSRPNINLDRIMESSSHTVWMRLPYRHADFDTRLNELIARDINVIVSINLGAIPRERVMETVRRYRSRVLVWEMYADEDKGAPYFLEIYEHVRDLNPAALVFPERIDHDYFQRLALNGLADSVAQKGTTAEVLNRGFWFFFVVIFIGLMLIISLGPILGYRFAFGLKEVGAVGLALLASAVLLIPALYILNFASLTLPRDFAQVRIAFSRFLLSAVFQEFLRALMLLLPVYYMIKNGISEKAAWWSAITASSLLFGLSHLGYPGFSNWEMFSFIIVTIIAGFVFGYLFYRTRSLPAIALVHLLSNVFFSTMTSIGPRM